MKEWILRAGRMADWLEKILKIIITICFTIMALAILTGVFTRNLNFPITWLEELSRYLQIWFVSLGFAVALRNGMLFGTEIFIKALPVKIAGIIVYLNKLLMIVISVFFLFYSTRLIKLLISTGQRSANLRIPIVWVYLGIYFGFVSAVIFLLVSILVNLVGGKDRLDSTFEPLDRMDAGSKKIALFEEGE